MQFFLFLTRPRLPIPIACIDWYYWVIFRIPRLPRAFALRRVLRNAPSILTTENCLVSYYVIERTDLGKRIESGSTAGVNDRCMRCFVLYARMGNLLFNGVRSPPPFLEREGPL
jgi:hypothetical protein